MSYKSRHSKHGTGPSRDGFRSSAKRASVSQNTNGSGNTLDLPTFGGTRGDLTLTNEDLSGDLLLHSAPRLRFGTIEVPALGGYPLISRLGVGGMGAVYCAINPRLNSKLAIKVMHNSLLANNPSAKDRFIREALLASRIKSPNLVRVDDVNHENDLQYIVMEYVSGINASKLPVERAGFPGTSEYNALAVCAAACSGLAAAHDHGIIHRDLKPCNILIPYREGTTVLDLKQSKLADLGLARDELQKEFLTGSGDFLGTLGFMSPEQIQDPSNAGKASDVFAFGATLYAMLSGESPFARATAMEVIAATVMKPHRSIRDVRKDISSQTADLLDRCLSKKPHDRFKNATALKQQLNEILSDLEKKNPSPAPVVTCGGTSKFPTTMVPNAFPGRSQARSSNSKKQDGTSLSQSTVITGSGKHRLLTAFQKAESRSEEAAMLASRKSKIVWGAGIFLVLASIAALIGYLLSGSFYDIKTNPENIAEVPLKKSGEKPVNTISPEPVSQTFEGPTPKYGILNTDSSSPKPSPALTLQHTDYPHREKIDYSTFQSSLHYDIARDTCIEVVLITPPKEKAIIGSPNGEQDRDEIEETQQSVDLTEGFYLGKFEVTQGQYKALIGHNPSTFKHGDNYPVENVTAEDAKYFCECLSKKIGKNVRLPNEAEWEYACRGTTSNRCPFHFGDTISTRYANFDGSTRPFGKNSTSPRTRRGSTTSVDLFASDFNAKNCFGLLGMHDNVAELCEEYDEARFNARGTHSVNGVQYVVRGGSWDSVASDCRSAHRKRISSTDKRSTIGFRVLIECGH